jgi:hypothetical protein
MTIRRTQASVLAYVVLMLVVSSCAVGCAIPVPVEILCPNNQGDWPPVTGGASSVTGVVGLIVMVLALKLIRRLLSTKRPDQGAPLEPSAA